MTSTSVIAVTSTLQTERCAGCYGNTAVYLQTTCRSYTAFGLPDIDTAMVGSDKKMVPCENEFRLDARRDVISTLKMDGSAARAKSLDNHIVVFVNKTTKRSPKLHKQTRRA